MATRNGFSAIPTESSDSSDHDVEGGGSDHFADENSEETPGITRTRRSRRGDYQTVATNNAPGRSVFSVCFGCGSFLCQTVVVVTAMLLIGTMGFLVGRGDPDFLIATLNATAGIDLTDAVGGSGAVSVGHMQEIDTTQVPDEKSQILCDEKVLNETTLDEEEEIEDLVEAKTKTKTKVRYDPSAFLSSNNHLDSPPVSGNPLLMTPPHPFSTGNEVPPPAGFLKSPHLVGDRLVFLSEGDAYVTTLSEQAMPAAKVTTTIGNVLDPKWHPTLPMMAYTATYTGHRDVYLMDFSSSSVHKSPTRLTYWNTGSGVNGLIGWIKTDEDLPHANALVFRAVSNEASHTDYRLYVLHLGGGHPKLDNATADDDQGLASVLEIEPVPLSQARDAARLHNCWYFVRVAQSSYTIRYVGGGAENLWKYCDGPDADQASQRLLSDDKYKGTSKSPQIYHNDGKSHQHYLFFLSDRAYDAKKKSWIPDRMNVWALPLDKPSKTGAYSTKNLIQITDTACDFEGKTIREYSIDHATGNLVARIGADLYFMSQADIQSKISRNRRRFLEEQDEEGKDLQKSIETELNEDDTVADEEAVGEPDEVAEEEDEVAPPETVEADPTVDESGTEDAEGLLPLDDEADDFSNVTDAEEFSNTTDAEEFSDATDAPTADPSESVAATTTESESESTEIASEVTNESKTKQEKTATKQAGADDKEITDASIDSSTKIASEVPVVTNESKTEKEKTATKEAGADDKEITDASIDNLTDTIAVNNSTEAPVKYFYDFQSPELVARNADSENDHFTGQSSEFKRLPIVVYSDFLNDQERILPVDIMAHYTSGDVFETITGSTQMLMTLRGQLWVAPVAHDDIALYKDAGQNMPARRYRVAPGALMGGSTRILAVKHVPNPVEDDKSDRRLAVILATDPLTPTAEHAFYLIETQPGATPLFVSMEQLPKPFLGGIVSGGSTRDGGLGSVMTDTLAMSPCGNRMAWSDKDGRIVVMNLPQYQELGDEPAKYVVLPNKNELNEPMIGDDVVLTFSPGGRYLAIEHHAQNRFHVISIADLGDPLAEENKVADIALGRIVQATPSKFNSVDAYWGKTPTDIHDLSQNKTMAKLFDLDEPDDVSTTLYFLSDRDILTDVSSPWGYRARMPHFVSSYGVYALPFHPKDSEEPPKGQFRGSGAEEMQVDALLERMELIQAFLDKKSAGTSASRREKRKLAESIHPLSGAFGHAEKAFENIKRRKVEEDGEEMVKDTDANEDDDHLEEAIFAKDMDIDFGPVDLSFARQAYRITGIPDGDYDGIVCQCPDGSLTLVEDKKLAIFKAEGFPSDKYTKKTFDATTRQIAEYSLSADRKFVILKYSPDGAIRVVPNSDVGMAELQSDLVLDENVVDKTGMHLSIWPTLEYRQLYDDAWRMMRDYFYDPDMTGIDWPAIHERYLPLVERCSKREELDDVLIQMSSELSALHVFVYGGEYNFPLHNDKKLEYANEIGSLGAVLKRTPSWKGYTVMSIAEANPDFTKIDHSSTIYSPLSNQSLRLSGQRGLQVGDVIVGVNGESVMTVPDIHMLLRGTAGRSIRLDVLRLTSGETTEPKGSDKTSTESKKEAAVESVITVPLSPADNKNLMKLSWEWKTEQLADKLASEAGISVGYAHLYSMSGPEAEDAFARGFFPNYQKQGFILDLRHNSGGNIDSWILDHLQRKAWMYWESRVFKPENGGYGWDEHYAFRGHVVVLIDEKTSSDGEGVSRGISELGLGRLIGTRTWGGGIWLSSDNKLVDGGIATAPETGDYNDNFGWGLGIEQMGVDPDIVVDNEPHETYLGKDRQLERAIQELKNWIAEEPVVIPKPKSKHKDMTMGERECKASP